MSRARQRMETAMVTMDRRVVNNQARQAMLEGAELEDLAEQQWTDGTEGHANAYATMATMKYVKAIALKKVGTA